MMTVESSQQQAALTDKIVRIVNRSKRFAKIQYNVDNKTITVEIQTDNLLEEVIEWCKETIKLIYIKYANDTNRIQNLYAALAYKFSDSSIVISETGSDGSGYTVYFDTIYPSQVIKV